MKVVKLDAFPVSDPYAYPEINTRVYRRGLTTIVVKLTKDNGVAG